MATRTVQEIERINRYKQKWKIKTNKNKFKIVPIAVKKKDQIVVDGTHIDYSNEGTVLGLRFGRTGIECHISKITRRGKTALQELSRFKDLTLKKKTHLIKAFVISIILYPPSPFITISKTKLLKLQVIQNKALRFALNEIYPYTHTTKTLHEIAEIEPVNFTVSKRTQRIYTQLHLLDNDHFQYLKENYER